MAARDQANFKASINIRRALFLEPTPQSTVRLTLKNEGEETEGAETEGEARSESCWRTIEGVRLTGTPIFNPFMDRFRCDDDPPAISSFALQHVGFINPTNPDNQEDRLPPELAIFHRADASWRNMLIMQPVASYLWCGCAEGTADELDIEDNAGMRCGGLVKALREHWMSCPNCPIYDIEGNGWYFYRGGDTMQRLDTDVTGWQMLKELEQFNP
ncbi:hypothetical protein LTR85_002955 [Meristemomyces frigidus]|nr:hypothetical protein LTR85_002955 [Meristemomyces frigidus]